MLPPEVLRTIRRIQLQTRRSVNDVLAGQYHSAFKGRGMEFADVREYTPGDDVRTIDWNVTARMGHPFVKQFQEERELTVMLVVDASASQRFGTGERFKQEVVAELGALLAYAAIQNNDKVGVIIAADQPELTIAPKKGRGHVYRVIREILQFQPAGRGTNLTAALEYLNHITHRRTVTFIISDFLTADYEQALRVTNRRHDVVALAVHDPRERELPHAGLVLVEDAETGAARVVDTGSEAVRGEFARHNAARLEALRDRLRACNVDHVLIDTAASYVLPLIQFFRMRERRLARA